jgi:hypothetical protein
MSRTAFPTTHIGSAESPSRFVLTRMQTAAHAPAAQYINMRDMGTWLVPQAVRSAHTSSSGKT